MVLGPRGERILAVRRSLGNERVDIVRWHAEPPPYIAPGPGLSYLPSAFLRPASRRFDILLADVDYRAARGRRDLNMLLTSALTDWRVRIQQIARSRSWRALQAAQADVSQWLPTSSVGGREGSGCGCTASMRCCRLAN